MGQSSERFLKLPERRGEGEEACDSGISRGSPGTASQSGTSTSQRKEKQEEDGPWAHRPQNGEVWPERECCGLRVVLRNCGWQRDGLGAAQTDLIREWGFLLRAMLRGEAGKWALLHFKHKSSVAGSVCSVEHTHGGHRRPRVPSEEAVINKAGDHGVFEPECLGGRTLKKYEVERCERWQSPQDLVIRSRKGIVAEVGCRAGHGVSCGTWASHGAECGGGKPEMPLGSRRGRAS